MQFSDEPNFTVAGVTDWSNVGLHGSDANVRTSESLAKETASLKPGAAAPKSAAASEADSHRLLGDAHEKGGDPLAAVNEYEKAVKLDPSEGNYFAWGSELLLHRGGIAAVEVFHKGALQHPKSERMRAGLGAAYYAMDNLPRRPRICVRLRTSILATHNLTYFWVEWKWAPPACSAAATTAALCDASRKIRWPTTTMAFCYGSRGDKLPTATNSDARKHILRKRWHLTRLMAKFTCISGCCITRGAKKMRRCEHLNRA